MLALVARVAKELLAAQPAAVAIGNIARRVLHIIREEVRPAWGPTLPLARSQWPDPAFGTQSAKLVQGSSGQRGLRTLLGPRSAEYGRLPFIRVKTVRAAAAPRPAPPPAALTDAPFPQTVIERVNELVEEFQGLSIALTDQSLDHINDKYVARR